MAIAVGAVVLASTMLDRTTRTAEERPSGRPTTRVHHKSAATSTTERVATTSSTVEAADEPAEPFRSPADRPAASRPPCQGGESDTGVTATRIRIYLGATLDGPRKNLVDRAPIAVKRVFDDVNRAGGICGRLLDVSVRNRAFASSDDLDDVAGSFILALAAPLDDDLAGRIADGTIDRIRLPVVATDGLDPAQSRSPWVWPLGPSSAMLARIAVGHAYGTAGARTFALVYDGTGHFGRDAADAVRTFVARLPGATLRHEQALDPSESSYAREAQRFNERCGDERCDVVILALLPYAESKWRAAGPSGPRLRSDSVSPIRAAPAQPGHCTVSTCPPYWWWTGITPPIEDFVHDPDVSRYAADVGDPNFFVTQAYVSAQVVVAALRAAGPTLTRAALRDALHALVFTSGLVGRVDWGPAVPQERLGIRAARALVVTADDTLRDAGTGWVHDPG